MHFSKCLTKANTLKTFGWAQLARVCFQGQTMLRNRRRNTELSTDYSCNWRTIELNGFFVLFCFLLFINLVDFHQRSKDVLQQAHTWLLHRKHENSRLKSASLFFPLGSLFPKSSCTNCLWGVHVPTRTRRERRLHHIIWSMRFPPGSADRRIPAMLVNPYVHI